MAKKRRTKAPTNAEILTADELLRRVEAENLDTRSGFSRARELIMRNADAKLKLLESIAPKRGPTRTVKELKKAYEDSYPFVWEFWQVVRSKAGPNGDGDDYRTAGWTTIMEWHRATSRNLQE